MVTVAAQPYEPPLINGEGTSEFEWRQSTALRDLAEFTLPPCDLAVVVAPHPDDETLALGGTISLLLDAGATVLVVTASDGAASHPNSPTMPAESLRRIRANESRTAIRVLGEGRRGNAFNVQLHLPDGTLRALENELCEHLLRFLTPDVICFATWAHDGHPDHEAVGRAARAACERVGATLVEFPVWTWHWARTDEPSIPWDRARRVTLNAQARTVKQRAVQCYQSQIHPLSGEAGDEAVVALNDLLHFERDFEVVFS
ncbi:MAG TPA: PIG-L family deacetylase [Acidimicrobiales bacterium]